MMRIKKAAASSEPQAMYLRRSKADARGLVNGQSAVAPTSGVY